MKVKNLYVGFVGLFLLFIGVLLHSNFSKVEDKARVDQRIVVSTSFYPLYFFASKITADKADVYNITPAGAEPHDYEPTAQDITKIESSKLLILGGGKLESWGDKIREILSGSDTKIIEVSNGLANKVMTEDGETVVDPHIWLSPVLAKKEIDSITLALKEVDPINAGFYEANAMDLKVKMDNLDQEFRSGLISCKKSDIITSHAAFSYLAEEYGLKQVAISGLSPDQEPSLKEMAEVAKLAKDNDIKYIFFESLVSSRLSDTIAKEIGAKTLVLNPLEGLTKDDIKDGKDYFSEMRKNLSNLRIALECQ